MRYHKRGQSMLEYTILLIIIIAAFITMQIYVKRGFQGRLKSSVDDLGEQYDPGKMNTVVTYTTNGTSETLLQAYSGNAVVQGVTQQGMYTYRTDTSSSVESKQGMVKSHY